MKYFHEWDQRAFEYLLTLIEYSRQVLEIEDQPALLTYMDRYAETNLSLAKHQSDCPADVRAALDLVGSGESLWDRTVHLRGAIESIHEAYESQRYPLNQPARHQRRLDNLRVVVPHCSRRFLPSAGSCPCNPSAIVTLFALSHSHFLFSNYKSWEN